MGGKALISRKALIVPLVATVLLGVVIQQAWALAYTVIDLNPRGFDYSFAGGISGSQQVGWGWGPATGACDHAVLWSGTAGSAVDLHQFLPPGFTDSYAQGIDSQGIVVGWARVSPGSDHAILWQPVPEPGTLVMLAAGLAFLLGYGWRRQMGGKGKKGQ
jgi:hypothetical protein